MANEEIYEKIGLFSDEKQGRVVRNISMANEENNQWVTRKTING